MTGAEYNHINDVIEDLYELGKLTEEDFCNLCRWIDEADRLEKYRWHDLRKDHNDLPNDDSIEFIVCVEYRNGKRECTVGCLDLGGEMMLLPELGNWIGNGYQIIAWREIEPFEGGIE